MRNKEMRELNALFLSAVAVLFFICYITGCAKKEKPAYKMGWEEDFGSSAALSENWRIKGKPGTLEAEFNIVKNDSNGYLNMVADKASASIVTRVEDYSPDSMPVLRWKWRVQELPSGADARVESKDDQAIGVYVGTGSMLSKKSIAYHWDTETPPGTEGKSTYGMGTIKVKWITLRNKTAPKGTWLSEKRNFIKDFKEAWGFIPESIYISISCNSQYTGTRAEADLDWIGLTEN